MQPKAISYPSLSWGLLALVGLLVVQAGCGRQSQAPKSVVAPLPVEVAQVELGPITEYIQATGRIEPRVRIQLATKLLGRIEEADFIEGQAVESGQLLVKIDATDVLARKAQARAAVAEAEAALKELEASQREVEALLQNAENNYERVKGLYDKKATTKEQYDNALAGFEAAKAKLDATLAGREVLRARGVAAKGQIQEADALLAYAELRAPVAGVVTEKNVEVGDMSAPGEALVVLEDLSQVKLELVVPEGDIPYVRRGQKVSITVDALPERGFEGDVETIIPSGDPLSHAFTVKVVLDNPQGELKPGMFVRAGIVKAHRDNALKIPLEAILEEDSQRFVYRTEDGRALRVNVSTGLQDLTSAEVLEGLSPGAQVVTRGKENLTHQSAVRIVNL